MSAPSPTFAPRALRAFTLIEIVVVLFIVGIVIAMAASITSALTSGQRLSITTTRLATVDSAILQFVMQQKRLPCPADGTLPSANTNAGVEMGRNTLTGCTAEGNGVVPWRALGLAENDATDGWNRRLTYRVQPDLAADSALDMSYCDPAGTEAGATPRVCNTACTSSALGSCTKPTDFLTKRGLAVQNLGGTVVMDPSATPNTGAAYVVMSAGSSGGGAYLASGVAATSTTTDGTQEQKNYANGGMTLASCSAAALNTAACYYVDDGISDVAGATHFDDLVSRPALLIVINKAGLGPRSH